MDTVKILAALDEEIDRLRQVRELLTGNAIAPEPKRRGRPATKATASTAKSQAAATPAGKKRNLSAEARERIAAAQRRRWAAQKGGDD